MERLIACGFRSNTLPSRLSDLPGSAICVFSEICAGTNRFARFIQHSLSIAIEPGQRWQGFWLKPASVMISNKNLLSNRSKMAR